MIGPIEALGMVKSYLRAKTSGTSLPEIQLQRLTKCFQCEWLLVEKRNSLGALDAKNGTEVENPYYYCKKCGCPKTTYWKDSELLKKVTFNKSECPLNKWEV